MNQPALLTPAPIEQAPRTFGRLPMAFGYRAIALFLVGLAWLIPAFGDSRFVTAMIAWDALVVVAWLVDFRQLPKPNDLSVRRTWLAPMALAVPSDVHLTLANGSNRRIVARLVDTVPPALRSAPPEPRIDVGPRSETTATYSVEPGIRGPTALGGAYLRYQSLLGLAERWATADLAQIVVTYPNLTEAKRLSMYLVRSRQIELERRSARVVGAGRAFESLREYRPGDEVRDICWTASARRGKAVTKRYEVERSQAIWLLLDSGRLMRARVAGLSKLDYAVNAALAVSQVALNSGDRVGMLVYGRKITHRIPAARGGAHLKLLVEQLARVQEDEWEGDHLLAAGRLLSDQKRRSLVIWITDLAETTMTPDVVRAAAHLGSRHVVLLVVIGEPDLQALARRTPGSVHEMYETAAAQEQVLRRESLLANLRAGGALAVETTAAGLSLAVVNGYLSAKQRNRI